MTRQPSPILSHGTPMSHCPSLSHHAMGHALTCGNVTKPACPTHILSHTTTRPGVSEHITAGHSVIHNQNRAPVDSCPTPPWDGMTCGNVPVPHHHQNKNPYTPSEFGCPTAPLLRRGVHQWDTTPRRQ